jgi:hypothetical protein
VNVVYTYQWGKQKSWNLNTRWNFGSGFPFTQTQGFYENLNLGSVGSNIPNQNGQMGVYYTDINTGRLPYFHRLDASISKKFNLKKERQSITVILAATNMYNRENIFYFDRLTYSRINQLPIMPTLGFNYTF